MIKLMLAQSFKINLHVDKCVQISMINAYVN